MNRVLELMAVMGLLVSLMMGGCGAGPSVLAGGEIEPGVYSGSMNYDMTLQMYNQRKSTRENYDLTIMINNAGNVVYEGNEFYIGAIITKEIAGMVIAEQVTNVTRGEGFMTLYYNVAVGMTIADGSYLELTGYGQETYQSNMLGGLECSGESVIGNTTAGMIMTLSYSGTLYR